MYATKKSKKVWIIVAVIAAVVGALAYAKRKGLIKLPGLLPAAKK